MAIHVDNPAGRLHAVLTRFADRPSGNSLDATWQATFGCQGTLDLSEYLSECASLLRDCVAAARSLEPEVDWPATLFHYSAWAKPIFGFDIGNRAAGIEPQNVVQADGLAALASLSTTLHHSIPECVFASGNAYSDLSPIADELEGIVAEVWADEELPEVVRSRICRKVLDAIRSIKYAQYRGIEKVAEDVQAAFYEVKPGAAAAATASPGILDKFDKISAKLEVISNRVWSMVAVPVGVLYLIKSGDFVGGGAILAANPQVASKLAEVAGAFKTLKTIGSSDASDEN
ncbi:hypothetical protein [Amycolatopsis sp. FDAARGOS 1241]|uniref:hypothetical protein n=1 Tax=Amycolatopsis sp. FDAARGOS 1241 TaxID=2778070 RepID=UPI001950B886|nr:hypothetical protein [Amycolatopsis sp. FDAARGOS 1241]QRP47405.1 hypothetical protein I6J71_05395 [Amycolatopsis sp. FDAARGOS 1241]